MGNEFTTKVVSFSTFPSLLPSEIDNNSTAVSKIESAPKETPKQFVHRMILSGNKTMIQKSMKRYWKWQKEQEKDGYIREAEKIFSS